MKRWSESTVSGRKMSAIASRILEEELKKRLVPRTSQAYRSASTTNEWTTTSLRCQD